MATFDSTPPASSLGRLSGTFTRLAGQFRHAQEARQTRKALSTLSARQLDDIGLVPGDIQRFR